MAKGTRSRPLSVSKLVSTDPNAFASSLRRPSYYLLKDFEEDVTGIQDQPENIRHRPCEHRELIRLSHRRAGRHLNGQLREAGMQVAEIWRYPVKSMAGESLNEVVLLPSGMVGDRIVQVRADDRIVTARTHPRLLGHRATLDAAGQPLVDGRPLSDPTVLDDVKQIAGSHALLIRDDDPEVRFDVLPLLIATDGAIAEFGRDRRRLRPNIVIGGVHGLDERHWPGGQLLIGEVVIAIDSVRGRCVMTTVDPDSLAQDPEVLKDIVRRFDGRLALNSAVVRGGAIRVDQPVKFVPAHMSQESASRHLNDGGENEKAHRLQ
jgi:hypothetical protein